ncbi:MAG: membrane dipeptidase [Rhodothermaceae bacterium]|nr:membrane dipeptidase [Rhodothermaceae bacterium]MYG69754.1 membrane dipeptidase [Rhodothermaceae bacterium]MYJ44321.1 membrane dipeptidase [Rhodothermaceae bacterium]
MNRLFFLSIFLIIPVSCTQDATMDHAHRLAQELLIIDGHIDVPYRLSTYMEDISQETIGGDFDYPKAVAGGLNAPFISVYIPSVRQDVPGSAKSLADSLIDMVEGFVANAPDKFAIATRSSDLAEHKEAGLVSLPIGMENGAPIESVEDLEHYYARGIRYITLTHGRDNHISDSSYDSTQTWGGLSPFGVEVVDHMNRMGIIVDISHLTDSAIEQVLQRTVAPVLATHSSARHFTPGWQRNISDNLIKATAANGGVIMVAFGSLFVRGEYYVQNQALSASISAYLEENNIDPESEEGFLYRERQRKSNPIGTVGDLVDHIDHIVDLVGIDHVGLGSDYDGVTGLPEGLEDVSTYPNLIAELIRRDYSEEDIAKILGGNALRVWQQVEEVAANYAPRTNSETNADT